MGNVGSKFRAKVEEWDSWEDEYSINAMRLRYRGFHKIGFSVLDLSPKYARLSIIMVNLAVFGLFAITSGLLAACYQMSDDFEECSGVCNLGLLSTLAFSFVINNNYFRKPILLVHHMLGKGLHDYQEPQYTPEEVEKCKGMLKKQNVALIIMASFFVLIGFVVVVACPLIDERFGWTVPYDENGVNRQLPVPLWLPFASHQGIGYWFAILFIICFGCALICLSLGACALMFNCISGGLILEQKLLALSIKNIEKRAELRFKALYKGKPGIDENGEKIGLIKDCKYQECITYCLRQNVLHHQTILTFSTHYKKIAGVPLLCSFFVESMAIAMSMVKLNEGSDKWGANIAFACIAILEVGSMMMMCVLGELVASGSNEVNQELYFTKWYRYNQTNKRMLLQFLVETRNPIILRPLRLVMMHSAYSFFNMVKLNKIREQNRQ